MKHVNLTFLLAILSSTLIFSQHENNGIIGVDTLTMVLPLQIASDTSYARKLAIEVRDLEKKRNYVMAYSKADTAFQIYKNVVGYETKETLDCLNRMAACSGFLQNPDKALSLFNKVLSIRKKMHGEEHVEVANSYGNIGVLCSNMGDDPKAIIYHNKSLEIKRKLFGEEHRDVAHSYNSVGLCYGNLGILDTAILFLQKSKEIRVKLFGENHPSVADSYNNLAGTYMSHGEYDLALELNRKAMNLRLSLFGENHPSLVNSYNNLAFCYAKLGYYDLALELLHKSLAILLPAMGENDQYVASTYNNLGDAYHDKEDYYKANEYYTKALQIRKILFGDDHPVVARSYHNIGNCFININEYDVAEYYLQKALAIKLKTLGEDHPEVTYTYNSLGLVYDRIGDFNKAIHYYQQALRSQSKIYGQDHPFLSAFLVNLADVYRKQKNVSSFEYLNRAIDLLVSNGWNSHPSLYSAYSSLAASYIEQDDYQNAIINSGKALKIINAISGEDSHPSSIEVLNNLAILYQAISKFDSAHFYITKALHGIQIQGHSSITENTKALFQFQNLTTFEKAIDITLVHSKSSSNPQLLESIFTYAEMAKAAILQFQIAQNNALSASGIPDSLLQKERELRLSINYREKQIQELLESGLSATDTTILRKHAMVFDLKRQQERFINLFETVYPEYYRLRYDLSTITLAEVQEELLKPNQSLLEYFVGDSSIHVITITKDTYNINTIKKDFPLDSLVSVLQSGLYGYYSMEKEKQDDALYKSSLREYTSSSTILYDKLVAPVRHLLTQDVIIVPDGVLSYIPFEALLSSPPNSEGRFESYPFLIKDHQVSYTYSATLLKEMKEKVHLKKAEKSLIAFAPFYNGSYARLDSMVIIVFDTANYSNDTTYFNSVVTRKDFASLPSSGEEVTSAAKLFGGDYFINSDATEQRFYDMAGDYRIVHLATHGLADEKQGDYCYLAFGEIKDSLENEFLYVRDIYNTTLNADLVVLSACETAKGEFLRGEGIISLARAFAYAGARSILTTLWVVDDATAKDLLNDFYINLLKGQSKDAALRNGKVSHLNEAKSKFKHPFFWAGFIAMGDMEAIDN